MVAEINPEQVCVLLLSINPDKEAGRRAAIAMSRVYGYVEAARTQVAKIVALERELANPGPTYSATFWQTFAHSHLYILCWAAVARLLEVIKSHSGLKSPHQIYTQYLPVLKGYSRARDHLEHYEERLPKGKKHEELANPSDFGTLRSGLFSIGGESCDVSESSFQMLRGLVAELEKGILAEGREKES